MFFKMWRELDSKVTDRVNEAKDNVKFMSALKKVCQSLYNSDPVCKITPGSHAGLSLTLSGTDFFH